VNATTSHLGRLVGAGFIAATLALVGCSNDSSSSTTSAESGSATTAAASADKIHNAADVAFAQDMIVHHQGAIEMANMATTQAQSQQVKDLAKRISAAQGPEIDQMTDWLNTWGEMVSGDSMAGMDHSSMPGMMTDDQMNQLMAASGADFDRMFLQMMTTHHQGAIEMANTEQADGSNPQAIALAKSIETSQTAEVAEMAEMLQSV
jgi:uncharacterized protein (DUF305 family)